MPLFDGITPRTIETSRLAVNILERAADDPDTPADRTLVLLHTAPGSSLFWQEIIEDLPSDVRPIAIDLRGFGDTERLPVDATRGVRDFSDDVRATLEALGLDAVHLVGWGLGAAVAMQYALDHRVLSLSLLSPVSPYGFGGTRLDGTRLTDDDAGCGAGTISPTLVDRLTARDAGDDEGTARSFFRTSFVSPDYESDNEDTWVEAMLTTSTAEGNYPGDSVPSENWPGFAAGRLGVQNTLAPGHFDVSSIVDLAAGYDAPPILWVRGGADVIVADGSFADSGHLGEIGAIPGWPGVEAAPAQQMVAQTRAVFDRYREAGGQVTEVVIEGVGHAVHLERPGKVRTAILSTMGYLGTPLSPAPPTEAIILSSWD
ncbi:alpha/beta fold hydrolase [Microbacterium arborescens]|uniref:alpha/beta fold hydrolase n=1 Tax=Microbacterium arborescens TaxID=33883 RepID=UPI0027818334|nr:alpha/beta hydrolase [Microbacterium arborescens]MDQ1217049.1 pimeloyl-ACP methyl ester carboxylesterase [Microbacterium arborescens]